MTRKESNIDIVRLLLNFINTNPDQRLGQALINLGIVERNKENNNLSNLYYEEPDETLERVKKALRGAGND